MGNAFEDLKKFFAWKRSKVKVDSSLSALHHTLTAYLFFACCFLVSFRQYFGEPLQCVQGVNKDLAVPEHVMNTYCFISSTFTLPNAQVADIWPPILHPGVQQNKPGMERHFHAYYQWIPIVLFLQGVSFMLPHFLWRSWEGGLIEGMVKCFKETQLVSSAERDTKLRLLAQYIAARVNTHFPWGLAFIINEVGNLLNTGANILFTDYLLGGSFKFYGLQVANFLSSSSSDPVSPMDIVFPKITKCTFYKYGPSGTIESRDAVCVMTLNIINEKIYTVLWYWLLLLSTVSLLAVFWRLVSITVVSINCSACLSQLMLVLPASLTTSQYTVLSREFQWSDWLLLSQLGSNTSQHDFRLLIQHTVKLLSPRVLLKKRFAN